MSEKFMCVCGKREQLNITNWKRHLDNCKARKIKISSRSITSFFPTPKRVRMNTESNYSCSNGKYYLCTGYLILNIIN